jgi:hypothetical protein
VSGDPLEDCFASFRFSAYRLETLPAYSVPDEAERIQAWREGLPRPERSVRTSGYLREVASHVLAGLDRARIRIADLPLSEYTRYELAGYPETLAAGEQIFVAVRRGGDEKAGRDLSEASDFWLFDYGQEGEQAVLMYYEQDGSFASAHLATAPDLTWCHRMWGKAARHAVALNEYLAVNRRATSAA